MLSFGKISLYMREQEIGNNHSKEPQYEFRPRSGFKRAAYITAGLASSIAIYGGGLYLSKEGFDKRDEAHSGFSDVMCKNGQEAVQLRALPREKQQAIWTTDLDIMNNYVRGQIEKITDADLDSSRRLDKAHKELAQLTCKNEQVNDSVDMANATSIQALNEVDKQISIATALNGSGNTGWFFSMMAAGYGLYKGLFELYDRKRIRKKDTPA